ncbi:MAG: magnesium transporter [Defluviitaleaceae bacterium]|nr:magnesium transporter [Defluviitaleaceae bacterium]MCL2836415.1 magnesium transporter [Defluviitaleaceae bacterium]
MIEKIFELMNEQPVNHRNLYQLLMDTNTVDIADVFEHLSREKVVQMFRLLPKSMAADVFSYIEPENQQIIVEALTDIEVNKIVEDLFVDDAVDFIGEMPANVVKRVLQSVSVDTRKTINQLLQYPEDSAGTIMTTEFVGLKEYNTVGRAFEIIRNIGVDKETIYTCYVMRRDRLLVGVVSVKTLLLSDPEDTIGDIMDTNMVFAHTTDDQEVIADLFKRYGLLSLPIVDKEGRLVGIVTVDDIVQVIEEETTEDFEKMAALTPSEDPYLKTSVVKLAKNRFTWLLLLMLSAAITGAILESAEEIISSVYLLAVMVPMIMDTAGNAGAQTSALIIRGMAVGEIHARDVIRVLWREIRVGTLCGCALALVNFARVFLMNGRDFWVSFTISVTLIVTVIIAKSVGCLLPILAKKIKIDPTVMAAPLITTIADASALLFYFYIARIILKI